LLCHVQNPRKRKKKRRKRKISSIQDMRPTKGSKHLLA
jgi:hypothetical protein